MSGSQTFPAGLAGRAPGRNDPCPCGSGRKYKQCCAIRPQGGGQTTASRGVQSPAAMRVRRDAARLLEAARFAEAIPLLQEAARLDPFDPLVRVDLGMALLRCDRVDEAADSLAQAISLDDSLARAHYQLGLALSRKPDVTGAIAAFRAALVRAPKLADAHIRLGDLLHLRGQSGQAAEAFQKAATILSGTTIGRLMAARALLMLHDRRDKAIALLRRARALDPKSIDAIRLLANTLVAAGRFDEAEEQLAQALALDPMAAADSYGLAMLRKITPADAPLIARMTALLRASGISEQDRMLLHFGLGKAYDDSRNFEAAVGHFDAANRIRGASAPLNRRMTTRLADRNIELFPRDGFDAAAGVIDERPVFILGLPRSGTTLVEQILSSHPGVAAGGELGYWGEHGARVLAPDAGPLTRDRLFDIAAYYQGMLRNISPDASRVTDKNPFNYLYIGLLRRVFPRAFIIHCRRHPVDTCLSMYTTYLASRDLHFMGNREDLVFYHGEYSRLMHHWRQVLPPGRFLEIDYESLVGDPEAEARRLVGFCELEWDEACLRPQDNRREVATASAWQARQPVYRGSTGRWRNYRRWLGPLADLLTDPQLAASQFFRERVHPTEGRYRDMRHPLKFSALPEREPGFPPLIGEHSEELAAELGFAKAEAAHGN